MAGENQGNLDSVDWSLIPVPEDDGASDHLKGQAWPNLSLAATSGQEINIGNLPGLTIVFAYPMTGRPDVPLPDNWDLTPGARGCTPQSCSFRDLQSDLIRAGAARIFGLSTQDTDYQSEAAERLHLPYPLLSDADLKLTKALYLPTMQVAGMLLLKRLTMAVRNGKIEKAWYPVFPPDQSAQAVLNWLDN